MLLSELLAEHLIFAMKERKAIGILFFG